MSGFVHLHVHTEYSLLDGAARIANLVKAAKEKGMPALAITDHGTMYGVIDFYKACRQEGIKPVIGCEVYVAPRKLGDRVSGKDDANYHLVLLAETNEGYRNLVKLVTLAHTEGYYYKPRVDKDVLSTHHAGLIALSGCLGGEVASKLLEDRYSDAVEAAREYEQIFGKGNFFLEIQDHGLEDQQKINPALFRLAEETGIPMVATNDIHYVRRDDAFIQDVLICIQTGKTITDVNRLSFSSQEFYLKSAEEMNLVFGEHPELLERSVEIAERCHVEFEFGQHHLPYFEVPPGFDSLDDYLAELCWQAFPKFYPNAGQQERERLEYELKVIAQTGFSGYFLIVADFCRYAREQGVAVGPGRGSAAASMVAYLLGITSVEPLTHDLLFERFLNPERVTMPDIDIDFDPDGREKVIRYVTEKYGADKVCQIITFGTLGAKAAIRDVGRVLGLPLGLVDKVAKLIPNELGMTLEKALQVSPDLAKWIEQDESIRRLYEIARSLEGMPRHASTHAAGVVIAKEPLTNYLPLQKTQDGFLVTQFPMKTVEEIGLLKMDFLGLRNLTILQRTVERIKEHRGIEIDLQALPLDDPKTYEMLSQGNSSGVFQLESGGMRSILKELKPSCFEDIIAVLALYRPGPMEQIPEFIKRKHGGNVTYLHPKLEKILKSTYGIIVYQEQVMQIARDLAGYSLGRADLLRRAMGKKKKEIMDQERQNFIHGLEENGEWVISGALRMGLNQQEAEQIFDLMAKFAEYGFNKGHATAYAVISYQTAYLKANYPLEFFTALISSVIGSSDKVSFYIQEARQNGINVLPPDVRYSGVDFTIENNAIRFGLGAIRNVGANVVEKIIEARQEAPFESLYDFCMRVDPKVLNKRVLESLIRAGAFSAFCSRIQGLAVLDRVLELVSQRQRDRQTGQISLFDIDQEIDEGIEYPDIPEFTERELLNMEKEYLGLYLSGHPLNSVQQRLKDFVTMDIMACLEELNERKVILGGMVTNYRQTLTKKGEMMASFILEDLTGTIEILVFPKVFAQVGALQNDRVVVVTGRYVIDDEEQKKIFAEKISYLEELDAPTPNNGRNPNQKFLHQAQANPDQGLYSQAPSRNETPDQPEGQSLSQTASQSANQTVYPVNRPSEERLGSNSDQTGSKRLYLRITKGNDKLMEEVLPLLKRFPGKSPVYFYFEEDKRLVEGNRNYWIAPSEELQNQLIEILGLPNVVWKENKIG